MVGECPDGYELQLVEVYPGEFEQKCVAISEPIPPSDVEPPPPPQNCNELLPPLNIICDAITNSGAWLADLIDYSIKKLQARFDSELQNIGIDLTDLGDWLNKQIAAVIAESQAFLDQGIKDAQEGTETAIAGVQTSVGNIIADLKTALDDWGNAQIGAIKESGGTIGKEIIATQTLTEEQIKNVRGEKKMDLTTLLDEIPKAIFDFVNVTIGPVLQGLNDTLEAS